MIILSQALGLWKGQRHYERAAVLFEKASLFSDASACYHLNGSYEDAVEVLRRGEKFDEMIQYLSQYVPRVVTTLEFLSLTFNLDIVARSAKVLCGDIPDFAIFYLNRDAYRRSYEPRRSICSAPTQKRNPFSGNSIWSTS